MDVNMGIQSYKIQAKAGEIPSLTQVVRNSVLHSLISFFRDVDNLYDHGQQCGPDCQKYETDG